MNETDSGDLLDKPTLFNWVEYAAFGSLLSLSALIGIYYGCFKKDRNSKEEYMLGGKSMHMFPIGLSLITSHVSGVSLLGEPAEVYEHGTQYGVLCLATLVIVYVTNKFYIPVFYPLQLNSLYEYLELRFSKIVRSAMSLIFALQVVLFTPVIIYIPCLAFNQGISIHHVAPIICLLCIFYTSIGGLKAVVSSVSVQSVFTFGALIAVIILGLNDVGGIKKVIEMNYAGDRLELFNMNPSLLAHNTFWTVAIGGFFLILPNLTIHPGSSQRFIALPTIEDAKRSVQMYGVGMILAKLLTFSVGLIVYVKYYACDPIKAGKIKNSGQLMPYYVQDVASQYPGLTGIFISGLISAALSTMSANLNTLSGTLYEDFYLRYISKNSSPTKASFIMKITVVCVGCLCVILVYLVEHLKGIIQMAVSLCGVTAGPMFAVFALGIFWPWANTKGVVWGTVVSVIAMLIIVVKAQLAITTNNLVFTKKPTFIYNCTSVMKTKEQSLTNLIKITDGVFANEDLLPIFALSYFYYALAGTVIAGSVGIVVSYLTGSNDLQNLNPDLFTPCVRKYLPANNKLKRINSANKEYQQVLQEMETYNAKI